jgi:hypothetical protein
MLDREKIVAVLTRRFPGSTSAQVAAAANALVGLDDEWIEVSLMPHDAAVDPCRQGCQLQQLMRGREIRIFSRIEHEQGEEP